MFRRRTSIASVKIAFLDAKYINRMKPAITINKHILILNSNELCWVLSTEHLPITYFGFGWVELTFFNEVWVKCFGL